jgi:hypothetical protein
MTPSIQVNRMLRKTIPLIAALCASGPAAALNFEFGDLGVQLNNLYTVGGAMRVEDREAGLIGLANGGTAYSTNGDDGNLAFGPGSLVAGATKLTSDLTLSYGDYGAFVRGTGIYNPAVDQGRDLFDTRDYGPGLEFGLDELVRKTEAVRSHVGANAELLDAYAYGLIPIGGRTLGLRVGRQAINWGESTFVLNGINSLLALDANKARVPGFDIAELVRPAGAVWASIDVVAGIAVEGFYQYEWRPTVIDAAGTYWSTNDYAGVGGTQANIGFGRVGENTPAGAVTLPGVPGRACLPVAPASPATDCVPLGSTIPRAPDRNPDDGGEYGLALRFPIEMLNDMDVGLYAMNYHSRLPVLSGISRSSAAILPNQLDTSAFVVEYPEDIRLYGVSFNTTVGDWALQGEYSLKSGQPLQIDDVELLLTGLGAPSQLAPVAGTALGNQYVSGYRRKDVSQVDFGVTRLLPPMPLLGYDQLVLLGEVALMHVHGMPAPEELAFEAPATYTLNAGTAALNPSTAANLPITSYDDYATATSWGYNLAARLSFNNVIGPMSLEPTLRFVHDVGGTSPSPIVNFVEHRKQAQVMLGFAYLGSWRGELGYVSYFGGGARNLLGDRDYVEAAIKYSF